MLKHKTEASEDLNPLETGEWLDSLDEVIDEGGPDRASYLLQRLNQRAAEFGVTAPLRLNTPYVNTIPGDEELPYPGNREIERSIKNYIRWNALAMARVNGAREDIVELFAFLHDSQRFHDGTDRDHGAREADDALGLNREVSQPDRSGL